MEDRRPQEVWTEACKKADEHVNYVDFEDAGDAAIEAAHELLAIAHQLKGVACCACNGLGKFTYVDTSTWRSTIGGQMVTIDVCDRCLGTGRADKTGPDMSRITLIEKQNCHLHLRIKSLVHDKIEALEQIEKWKEATGLEKGGDPVAVTPDDLCNELANLRATQEKSWRAADEALAAEHDCEMSRVALVLEQFCHQCAEGSDPGACPDCLLHSLGGGKDSTRLTAARAMTEG